MRQAAFAIPREDAMKQQESELKYKIILTFSIFFLLLTMPTAAAPQRWQFVGTINSSLDRVSMNGCARQGKNFMAGDADLFVSEDQGQHWFAANFPIKPVTFVQCNDRFVFAGHAFQISMSSDNGKTWTKTDGLQPTKYMPVDPIITDCRNQVFLSRGSIDFSNGTITDGTLMYLDKNTWRPFDQLTRERMTHVVCYRDRLIWNDESHLETIAINSPSAARERNFIEEGLHRPCENPEFDCPISILSPLLVQNNRLFIFTGEGIYEFLDDQSSWKPVSRPISLQGQYFREIVKCDENYILFNNRITASFIRHDEKFLFREESVPSTEFRLNLWSDSQYLYAITSEGKVYRTSCNE